MSASPILELITAFRRSKTMFAAVQLGIFDCLEPTPKRADEIAHDLKLNLDACRRLLDACVALQLLSHHRERYENPAIATKYLLKDSPDTLAGYIIYSDQSLYPLWGHLADAVREGSNRWEQVFGSRDALFDHYFRDESATEAFLGGMHGFGQLASPLIVRAFDLSGFRHLVDLGGATGHLAIAACRAYPHLRATVVDLPKIEAIARRTIQNSDVSASVEFVGGDFFVGELIAGDLYYLGRILHDWSDEKIVLLLRKICDRLLPGGGLLVGETLLDDNRSGPLPSVMQDLNMLVCTDGRERTRAEYRSLLESAGFTSVDFRETGSLVDAILAIK
jgi:acetylserotonin N-methyltransferase